MVIRTEKVAQTVAREIVRDVATNNPPPGTVLAPESEMMQTFGVSRASLREALRILEVLGLIEMRTGPHGGPVVRPVDARNFGQLTGLYYQLTGARFSEVLEARLYLEPVSAGMAAERRTDEDVVELNEYVTETEGLPLGEDAIFRRSGQDFHQMVSRMSGNRVFNLLVHSCTEVFHGRVSSVLYPRRQRRTVNQAHIEIAQAIISGDSESSQSLMREHMSDYVATVNRQFRPLMSEVVQW